MNQVGSPVDLGAEQVNELARNFWYSAILRAGIKLDVFRLLEDDALTSQEIAHHIGASPRYTQSFLDCCVVLVGNGGTLTPVADAVKRANITANGQCVKSNPHGFRRDRPFDSVGDRC